MKFEIQHKDENSKAGAGSFETDHGRIETPIFMPVGTYGTVKAEQLKNEVGAQIVLGNTYHFYLRPGTEILENTEG